MLCNGIDIHTCGTRVTFLLVMLCSLWSLEETGLGVHWTSLWACLVAQLVKDLPAMQETWVQSLGWEDLLEEEKATHSSILVWRIPWTVWSMELQRVWHDRAMFTTSVLTLQLPRIYNYFTIWFAFKSWAFLFSSVQFGHSAVSSCLQPCGLQHVRHPCPSPTPELAQTQVHRVGDAIQPSHLLSSPPAFNLFQHQDLFKWVSSSHQVAKVLEFQLQHQSFQQIFRTDFI